MASTTARNWVLFIDDLREDVEAYSDELQRLGFNVLTASSGEQGCDKAYASRPDIILLDLMLPDIDGWQVCRRLQGDARTMRIPIVMLTARVDRELRKRARQAGCAGYLTKPCDSDTLASEIKRVLAAA